MQERYILIQQEMNKQLWIKRIKLIAATLLALVLVLLSAGKRTPNEIIIIANVPVSVSTIRGVMQVGIYFAALLMISIDYKIGYYMAMVILALYTFQIVMAVIITRSLEPLPGIVNGLMSLIIVTLTRNGIKKSQRESIMDFATGIFNRRGFLKAIQRNVRKGQSFHVLYVRIKNIRSIVDTKGYEFGDTALRIIGGKIRRLVEKVGFVAKFDGREFVVAIRGNVDPIEMAQKILDELGGEIVLDSDGVPLHYYLPVYIGISSYPEVTDDVDKLIRCAAMAMNKAVSGKKNHISVYNADMEKSAHRTSELEKIIKNALENHYFYLVYQPQYVLEGKKLRGFETLIRLKQPDGTMVSPGEFIPVAENSDFILDIDDYVLRRAMTEFKDAVIESGQDFVFSINVSARDMASADFVEHVRRLLDETGFPSKCLEIEITEYSFEESNEQTTKNIIELKKLGVMIALDDFGTGYTSLSQLLHLPVDLLKIDKSLIDDIEDNKINQDFVKSVIYMGHLMKCEVISEGVETEKQLEILKELGCDYIQGFIWGKPLEYDKALEIAKNH